MATSYTKSFDDFASATMDLYCNSKFQNGVFDDIPLFKWLAASGRAVPADGGNEIVEPVMLSTNGTAKAYSPYEDLDTTPSDAGTVASFPWARYAVTVAISGDEKDRNRGKQQVIDLLKGKMEQAEMSMQDLLSNDLFSAKAGTDGKSLIGLQAMIAVDPTTVSVGRIATSEVAWRNVKDTNAYTFSTGGEAKWESLLDQATNHGTRPDLIVTTRAIKQKYSDLLRTRGVHAVSDLKVGDSTFRELTFSGVPVMADLDCPANMVFFLTSKRLKYRYNPASHFRLTEAKQPANKDATYWQIIERCQLTTNDRSILALSHDSISAATWATSSGLTIKICCRLPRCAIGFLLFLFPHDLLRCVEMAKDRLHFGVGQRGEPLTDERNDRILDGETSHRPHAMQLEERCPTACPLWPPAY